MRTIFRRQYRRWRCTGCRLKKQLESSRSPTGSKRECLRSLGGPLFSVRWRRSPLGEPGWVPFVFTKIKEHKAIFRSTLYIFLLFFRPWSFQGSFLLFFKLRKCSILSPWCLNSNLYTKYRVLFEISRHAGNIEHQPFFEKSPTRSGKTMLNGFATPSIIFGLAFRLKQSGEKKSGIQYF